MRGLGNDSLTQDSGPSLSSCVHSPLKVVGKAGLEYLVGAAYSLPMNELRPPRRRRAETPPDLAPPGTPPHVAVAPGLLDHEHVVIRADDDTDEDYEANQLLLDAALAFARRG